LQLVRRIVPPTEAAAQLKELIRHRYELIHESTQRKNKLTAICDEIFPELTRVVKDPNSLEEVTEEIKPSLFSADDSCSQYTL
jgi:hypothetical protein